MRIEGGIKHTAEVKEIKDALYSAEKERSDMQQIKVEYGEIGMPIFILTNTWNLPIEEKGNVTNMFIGM